MSMWDLMIEFFIGHYVEVDVRENELQIGHNGGLDVFVVHVYRDEIYSLYVVW